MGQYWYIRKFSSIPQYWIVSVPGTLNIPFSKIVNIIFGLDLMKFLILYICKFDQFILKVIVSINDN